MNVITKSIVAISFTLMSLSAMNSQAATMQETITHCTNISNLSASVMQGVQSDMSYEMMMNGQSESVMPLMNALYTDAMQQPSMRSDDGKATQIKEFKRVWFTLCMKDQTKES